MNIAKCMYHIWEEEPISGIARGFKGTFAIFFLGCNMRCVYCQNSKISKVNIKELKESKNKIKYSVEELSDEMIKAEKAGAASISFITGVLYIDEIAETIKISRKKGLTIPIVYNTSSYEPRLQLKKLNGLIDIYLADLKYSSNILGKKYSNVNNYFDVASDSINEMYNQVGTMKFSEEDLRTNKVSGLIIRHLVLPSNTEDSKKVIKYIYDNFGENVVMSIMSQYTPMSKNAGIDKFKELNRPLTKREYEKVVDYAISIGVKNAYIQDGDVASESFIPDFNY